MIKKTRFPHWDEVLEFELAEGELGDAVLSVEVWDWDIVGKNDFLGRVRVSGGTGGTGAAVCTPSPGSASPPPQVELPLDTSGATKGWFQLLPFASSAEEPG